MSVDWSTLRTFADWAEVLQTLLQEAQVAVQSRDLDARVRVQVALNEFIMCSPNHLAKQLDEIARRTVEDLFRATAEEAILSIASRTAELSLHAKTIAAATAEARHQASSIRLEAASHVLDASTEAIRAMARLRQQLKGNASDKALAESIDSTVAVLQKLVADIIRE